MGGPAPDRDTTLPELWNAYPGWVIHNASCVGGCCEQYEAVYEEGTVLVLVVRTSLGELARRLDEITDGGTLPPRRADLRRRRRATVPPTGIPPG